ncbi:solute carrier family 15 member 4-like [Lineus longissimus]|uniref:solute carrier family 15 member 4-like n=1 Tax=Lineus longissimus TaxID=88925 RepID=UPI00315C7ACE
MSRSFIESKTYQSIKEDEVRKRDTNAIFIALRIPLLELCERLTFHSIASNLVMFCTNHLKFDSVDAVTISLIFTGTCYLVPPIAGWIADSYIGQYNALLASALLHMLGTFFLPAAAFYYTRLGPYEMPLDGRRAYFLIGIFLVAIATGGVKANCTPFGARQVEHVGTHAIQTFFAWYYWCMTIGCIIAYTLMVYIQQEVNFALGYLIPGLTMMLAITFFITARKKFIVIPPKGSQIAATCKIIYEALCNKYKQVPLDLPSFLDYAKIHYGGSRTEQEVEDVKMLGGVFPIFLTGMIYWTIFAQTNSSYLLQAERMNLHLGSFTLPAASLHIFIYGGVILLIPLLDRVIYPLLDSFWRRPTPLIRMGLGFLFASASAIIAGILEYHRKIDIKENGATVQVVGGENFYASQLSVLYQVPQFLLFGMSLVFMEVTSLEFAFREAPLSMKAVVTGIFLITIGLGQYLSSLLLIIVNAVTANDPWYPDEINDGYLDYFFYLLAGLIIVGLIIFTVVARRYEYASDRHNNSVKELDTKESDDESISSDIGLLQQQTTTTADERRTLLQRTERYDSPDTCTEF